MISKVIEKQTIYFSKSIALFSKELDMKLYQLCVDNKNGIFTITEIDLNKVPEIEKEIVINDKIFIYSDNKEQLIKELSKYENLWKKNRFDRLIKQCLNEKKLNYTEEESASGSKYYSITTDGYRHLKIRLSDHPAKSYYCQLGFRYDKQNMKNKNLINNIRSSIDRVCKLGKRSSLLSTLESI